MKILLPVLLAFALMQVIPYGHAHTNPPATGEPQWDSPQTRELMRRACFDCHSNETDWRWYANVAPVSWLVQRDVNGGRSHLNFTDWAQPQKHAKDVAAQVQTGNMPPWFYLPLHSSARLSDAEKLELTDGAAKSLGPQTAP